jgi:hypothetical protein
MSDAGEGTASGDYDYETAGRFRALGEFRSEFGSAPESSSLRDHRTRQGRTSRHAVSRTVRHATS